MRIFSWISIIFCMVCFSACTTTETYAPVMDATQIESIPKNGQYRVVANDTLYSIAWRYGLDYRDLAQLNHISRPYPIEIGQVLYLSSKAPSYSASTTSTFARQSRQQSQNTSTSTQNTSTSTQNISISTQKTSISTINQPTQKQNAKWNSLEPVKTVNTWYRPAKGPIIATYSAQNKGLNFGGKLGDPVFATAEGKVVYSGNGLRGYGNLIIIKHNSTFLSAYAHNNNILVKEGEWVRAKQKIAEMGSTGTRRVMLHFEIRRNGKPVNPLHYLN